MTDFCNRQHSGILKEVTTHGLRHTYAAHLLEMGMDIMSLKDLLGHVDIQTTDCETKTTR